MVLFVRGEEKYLVYVNGTLVGSYSNKGIVFRYTVPEGYMGTMSREDAYRLFVCLYS
jgi:hypothetical protein